MKIRSVRVEVRQKTSRAHAGMYVAAYSKIGLPGELELWKVSDE